MNKKLRLLGYYDYTVILTYIGMLAGFAGLVCAFEGKFSSAVICLMLAGFCDMFDGAVAHTRERTEQEKCFGIQIDSLSDLICFGVLPGLLVYSMNRGSKPVMCISALYILCALIRLAYFNVDEQERQKHSAESRKIYFGLPVTLSALFVPALFGAGTLITSWNTGIILSGALITMAAAFLIPFQTKKPKLAGKIVFVLLGLSEVALVIVACLKARP